MAPAAVAKRQEMVQLLQLQTEGNANPVLLQTMAYGIAFHHAGLTPDERSLVEQVRAPWNCMQGPRSSAHT